MNIEAVRSLLLYSNDLVLNSLNANGASPLLIAVNTENVELITCLVHSGSDVNFSSTDGTSPLHVAVYSTELPVVECLLTLGADVNALDNKQHSPLFTATFGGLEAIARVLIAAGADSTLSSVEGNTPLIYSAQLTHNGIVKSILEAGVAAVNQGNNSGHTPLTCACQSGNIGAVRLLVEVGGAKVNLARNDGATALFVSVVQRSNGFACAEYLIEKGADVSAKKVDFDGRGQTVLAAAAHTGHLSIVRLLVERGGADVNQTIDLHGRKKAYGMGNGYPPRIASYLRGRANSIPRLAVLSCVQRFRLLEAGADDSKLLSNLAASPDDMVRAIIEFVGRDREGEEKKQPVICMYDDSDSDCFDGVDSSFDEVVVHDVD